MLKLEVIAAAQRIDGGRARISALQNVALRKCKSDIVVHKSFMKINILETPVQGKQPTLL